MPKGRPRKNLPAEIPPSGATLPAPLPSLKEQAKELYLTYDKDLDRYRTPDEIISALGISSSQLNDWRHNGEWVAEREELERSLLEERFAVRRRKTSRIADMAVGQLDRAMTHLANRPEPPTIGESEKLANVLMTMDKIGRLDLGKSTENLAVGAKLSVERVQEIIQANPFFAPAVASDQTPE